MANLDGELPFYKVEPPDTKDFNPSSNLDDLVSPRGQEVLQRNLDLICKTLDLPPVKSIEELLNLLPEADEEAPCLSKDEIWELLRQGRRAKNN